MQKYVGTSAGFLGLLAILIHTMAPPPSEQANKNSAAETSSAKAVNKTTKRGCAEETNNPNGLETTPPKGPWLASQQYFHWEPKFETTCVDFTLPPTGSKSGCNRAAAQTLFGIPSASAPSLETLIATIPDPLHTRMSLASDRDLDAIQGAAFAAGWEMATQWLPWTAKASQTSEAKAGEASTPSCDVENFPGLIVFRRHFTDASEADRLLFVFVVGETPTAGINGFQFAAALNYLDLLPDRTEEQIRILGPTFSGSFISLTKLIEENGGNHKYEIRAGSVSNSYYAASMRAKLPSSPTRKVTFYGSTLPSASFSAQFQQLRKRYHFEESETAELVEDESGFSYLPPPPSDKTSPAVTYPPSRQKTPQAASSPHSDLKPPQAVTYRYPRDIAQLRDAYSDIALAAQPKTGTATSPALQFSLKDQSGESDFPIFSTSHTPVSQNAVLEQIVSDLKREGVRLLSLSASNIFDTLFIANVLAKECPDMRVVVSGADLLFVQEASQNSLSGILAISPFPMFSQGFKWTNDDHVDTTFPDSYSVEEYNATLELLKLSPAADTGKPIAFAPSLNTNSWSYSSAWLLVLGRHGWAPVDLFDQRDRPVETLSNQFEGTWFDPARKPDPKKWNRPIALPPAPSAWTILCLLTGSVSLAFCGRLAYLARRTEVRSWSSLCTVHILGDSALTRLAHARYVCLLACLSSVAFLNGILLIPMTNPGVVSPPLYIFVMAACAAPFLAAGLLLYGIDRRHEPPSDFVSKRYLVAVRVLRYLVALLPLVGLFFWYTLCFTLGASSPFFCFRVLNLALPISPIWPPLLAATALFLVAFFHLRRLTWAERRQPELDTSLFQTSVWGHIGSKYCALNDLFSGPASPDLARRGASLLVILAGGFVLALLFPSGALQSFENIRYQGISIALLLPLSMAVGGALIRFALSWRILRDLLATLDSLEIGRFFARFPDFDGSGPVWIRDLHLMSLAASANSAIALHNLQKAEAERHIDPIVYWNPLREFSSPTPDRSRLDLLRQYKQFLKKGAEISQQLSKDLLEPFMKENRIPFVQGNLGKEASGVPPLVQVNFAEGALRAPAPLAFVATAGGPSQPALPETKSTTVSAEGYEMAFRYVAFQYSIFIGYALRHIQNLLLCSVLSFVLLVLALNSFSFEDTQAISRLLVAALIVSGIVVLQVLAQIERNPVISRLSGSDEGVLGKDFYQSVIVYGALPVLTVLGTQFPSIARFLTSWAEPSVGALK